MTPFLTNWVNLGKCLNLTSASLFSCLETGWEESLSYEGVEGYLQNTNGAEGIVHATSIAGTEDWHEKSCSQARLIEKLWLFWLPSVQRAESRVRDTHHLCTRAFPDFEDGRKECHCFSPYKYCFSNYRKKDSDNLITFLKSHTGSK